jgi:hypothetical protein
MSGAGSTITLYLRGDQRSPSITPASPLADLPSPTALQSISTLELDCPGNSPSIVHYLHGNLFFAVEVHQRSVKLTMQT